MDRTMWMTATQEKLRWQPRPLPETGWGYPNCSNDLLPLLEGFSPITLDEMEAAVLLNRVDTKFVMTAGQLLKALVGLWSNYRILSIHGHRLNHYRTLYFDTPDFRLYNLHVTGRAERYKVRSREYTDSALSFLEVKHKTRKDRTIKNRVLTALPVLRMTLEAENWLSEVYPYNAKSLESKLWNTFTRITLVGKETCERVTLDTDLSFYTADRVKRLNNVAIAEVKMEAEHKDSPFIERMQTLRIRSQGFSKYCVGVSLLYDHVKKNLMKPRILQLEKMTKGVMADE